MSQRILDRLKAALGPKILETRAFRGDEEATVAPADWRATLQFLRDDADCAMNHFIDITAVDYPERTLPRFDVLCFVRSQTKNHRVRVRTRVGEGEQLDSLFPVYEGANWTEREVFDMFGIVFRGHPDLRRILMYDEFVGYPLRKDYPIAKTQPLMPYRQEDNLEKLPPFGADEGQPFGRIDWEARLQGADEQVSPALALQQKQKHALSESSAVQTGAPRKDD